MVDAQRLNGGCGTHEECGCKYGGPCCLACPRPECVLIDPPPTDRGVATALHVAEITRLYSEGFKRREIAEKVGLSMRSVSRLHNGR